MKFIGIDYGDKNIGIAVSDEEGKIAFPRTTIQNDGSAVEAIWKLCTDETIGTIVVGVPISFSGMPSEQEHKTRAFGKLVEHMIASIPVAYENEIFTTKIGKTDAGAAAVILQGYLDRMRE
ncbi:MAG: Holliday junction resolvase RuvX [Patescibacteria group bacterium]